MEQNFNQNENVNQNNNNNYGLDAQVEQPVNPQILFQSQQGSSEEFNTKQYKEDLQSLKAKFDQQQNATAPSMAQDANNANVAMETMNNNNKDAATIVTVQVPVAVPVEVPVPVQVPVAVPVQVPVGVPVYVPVAIPTLENTTLEAQLQRQAKTEALPQTSNDTNLYTGDITSSNDNNNYNNYNNTNTSTNTNTDTNTNSNTMQENELLLRGNSLDLTDFKNNVKENINYGIEQVKDTYNNLFKSNKESENKLSENKLLENILPEKKIEKPESSIFNEEKQPLISQPLEEEDKKEVHEININNTNNNSNIKSDFISNELHDIKKEHKEIPEKSLNENNYSTSFLNILNSGIESVKDTLGMGKKPQEAVFEQEKESLIQQPLEKEDQKPISINNESKLETNNNNNNNINNDFPVEIMYEIKKEHNEIPEKSSTLNENTVNVIDNIKSTLNSGMENVKENLGLGLKNKKSEEQEETFEQENESFVQQLLEEDKKERLSSNLISKENKIENINEVQIDDNKEELNKEFEQTKQSEILQTLEQENAIISDNLNLQTDNTQSSSLINKERPYLMNETEELTPLLNNREDNFNNLTNLTTERRSYADVVGSGNKSNKDISSSLIESSTQDDQKLSEPILINQRDGDQLDATKQNIPSQQDIAPQINDTSA